METKDPAAEPNPAKFGKAEIPGILGALALLGWRVFSHPLRDLWRDWMAVLALSWILSVFAGKSRAGKAIPVAAALYLLVVYAVGQFPHTLAVLGYQP
jgi:hypothetical protein